MASSKKKKEIMRIGPIDYQVKVVKDLRGDDGQSLWGDIQYNNSTIRLDAKMKAVPRRITLWHENLHAVLAAAGYNDHDEQQLVVLAHGVVGILRDNPWLRDGNETRV